ncbi:hypothetical protein S40293_11033 [Stachybotrys chartarum IBT 40293]|nr:hypothetical protein S40293_11033 [Stachybotrys chartarum IBT 40293]
MVTDVFTQTQDGRDGQSGSANAANAAFVWPARSALMMIKPVERLRSQNVARHTKSSSERDASAEARGARVSTRAKVGKPVVGSGHIDARRYNVKGGQKRGQTSACAARPQPGTAQAISRDWGAYRIERTPWEPQPVAALWVPSRQVHDSKQVDEQTDDGETGAIDTLSTLSSLLGKLGNDCAAATPTLWWMIGYPNRRHSSPTCLKEALAGEDTLLRTVASTMFGQYHVVGANIRSADRYVLDLVPPRNDADLCLRNPKQPSPVWPRSS